MITQSKNTRKEDLDETVQKLTIKNIELTDKLESLQTSLNSLLEENQRLKRENFEAEKKISAFETQSDVFQLLSDKNSIFENTINDLKAEIAESNLKNEKISETCDEKGKTAEKNQNENVELHKKLEKLKNELFIEKETTSNLEKNLSDLSAQNELITKKLYETQSEKTLLKSDLKIKFEEIKENAETLHSANKKLEKNVGELKTQLTLAENSESDLKLEIEKIVKEKNEVENDFKDEAEKKTELITVLEANCGNKDREIMLLKSANENLEDHIKTLTFQLSRREQETLQTSKTLTDSKKSVQNLEKRLSFSETAESADTYLAKFIKETSATLCPTYDPAALRKFDASPVLPASELYLLCVAFYDDYKAAFKEKLALEDGLRRFARHVQAKSPLTRQHKTRLTMLKKSYGTISRRLETAKTALVNSQVRGKELKNKFSALEGKKSAYKKSVAILKAQVQSLFSEQKVGGEADEFVFRDFNELHDKYMKLLKTHTEHKKRSKAEHGTLEAENRRVLTQFETSRAGWKAQAEKERDGVAALTAKVASLGGIDYNAPASDSLLINKAQKNALLAENKRYEALLEKTNENLNAMQKDRVNAISAAEKRAREAEEIALNAKIKADKFENAVQHETKMRKLSESEIQRLRETNERDRKDLASCREKIKEFEGKKDNLKSLFEAEKKKTKICESEVQFLKGSLSALKNSEKMTLGKLTENKELLAIQTEKIARLEETNRQLCSEESIRVDRLLSERARLETDWHNLRQARELDLKCGREALQQSNSLASRALADLHAERQICGALSKDKEELQKSFAELSDKLAAESGRVQSLEKFQKLVESSGLSLVGQLGEGKGANPAFEISVKKVMLLEREAEDLRTQKEGLGGLLKSKGALLLSACEKLKSLEKSSKEQLSALAEENQKLSARFYKSARSLQQTIISNSKIAGELKEAQNAIKNLELKIRNEASIKSSFENDLTAKLRGAEGAIEAERRAANELVRKYENEVSRHAETIGKLNSIEKTMSSSSIGLKEHAAIVKRNEDEIARITSEANASRASMEEENSELRKSVERRREKAALVTSELVGANSLNRYLRRKYGAEPDFCRVENEASAERTNEGQTGDEKNTESSAEKSLERYKVMFEDNERERCVLENKLQRAENDIGELKTEIELKMANIESLHSELKKMIDRASTNSKTEQEIQKLEDAALHSIILTENNRSLREKLKAEINKAAELETSAFELSKKLAPKDAEIALWKGQNADFEMRLSAAEELAKDWEARCLKMFQEESLINPEEHDGLKKALTEEKEKSEALAARLKECRAKVAALQTSQTEIAKKLAAAESAVAQLKSAADSESVRSLSALRTENSALNSKVASNESDLNFARARLANFKTELEKYKLLVKKTDAIIKEEKETSAIFERNAQSANARALSIQKELQKARSEKPPSAAPTSELKPTETPFEPPTRRFEKTAKKRPKSLAIEPAENSPHKIFKSAEPAQKASEIAKNPEKATEKAKKGKTAKNSPKAAEKAVKPAEKAKNAVKSAEKKSVGAEKPARPFPNPAAARFRKDKGPLPPSRSCSPLAARRAPGRREGSARSPRSAELRFGRGGSGCDEGAVDRAEIAFMAELESSFGAGAAPELFGGAEKSSSDDVIELSGGERAEAASSSASDEQSAFG